MDHRRAAVLLISGALVSACSVDEADTAATTTAAPTTTVAVTTTRAAATTTAKATTTTAKPSEGVARLVGSLQDDIGLLDSPFFLEPVALLRDESSLVRHSADHLSPESEAAIGRVTNNATQYTLDLPATATGPRRDVDNDARSDPGVSIYSVSVVPNTWGDSFLEDRDLFGGELVEMRSIVTRTNADGSVDVTSGNLVVFSPDSHQEFPTGPGPDHRLFTADDPVAKLPKGWSVVNVGATPYTVHHEERVSVDVSSPDLSGYDEIDDDGYANAFDHLVDTFRTKYVFTDLKHLDWDALAARFRPLAEQADQDGDETEFGEAVDGLVHEIPDIHVKSTFDVEDVYRSAGGTIGMALVETTADGVLVTHVDDGGAAQAAGIVPGARIVSLGGRPITDAITATKVYTGPFSNPAMERIEKVAFSTYFERSAVPVEVTFTNPGGSEQTASLEVRPNDAGPPGYIGQIKGTELPIEVHVVDDDYAVVTISSFLDDFALMIRLWERALQYVEDNGLGLIVDMRANGGGSLWIATQMAAYFYTGAQAARTKIGVERYDPRLDQFTASPDAMQLDPPDEPYEETFAVLVGSGCVSACEVFSYLAQQSGQGVVVGHTATQGGGGLVGAISLPSRIFMTYSIGRMVDADGQVVIEGTGVVPDVLVPVTPDTVTRQVAGEDVLVTAAEDEVDTGF